jgi:hypothetical protein
MPVTEQAFGKDHLQIATLLDNVITLYKQQNRGSGTTLPAGRTHQGAASGPCTL